jgi:hypothetical protein
MPEARNAPRIVAKQQGIVHINGRPEIACTVRNLSNTGAQLNFSNPTILPRAFHLKFDGSEQRVTVIWQSGRLAGVRFQTPLRGIGAAAKRKMWPWSRG